MLGVAGMSDLHVERLHYRVSSDASIAYKDPEPITIKNYLGEFRLSNGTLVVTPSEHFSGEPEAKKAVEPFLRAWEMEADLLSQIRSIRFGFERSEIIDRNPPRPGERAMLSVESCSHVHLAENVSLVLTRKKYPAPPVRFTTTRDVEMAYRRWLGFKDGKESLPSMAYFVLTILEQAAGGRKEAAATYAVEKAILDQVGNLSSTKGDPETARKAAAASVALTEPERLWLEDATRKLIFRLGEHASGKPLITLHMKSLLLP